MRVFASALTLATVALACQPSPTPALPTARATPTPIPVPSVQPGQSLTALRCAPDEIEVAAAGMPDPGYVTILTRLVSGGSCLIRLYPLAILRDRNSLIVEESRPAPGPVEFYPLKDELEFDLLWETLCGQAFARPLTAEIAFVDNGPAAIVELPNEFEPARCDGGRNELFVEPAFTLGDVLGG